MVLLFILISRRTNAVGITVLSLFDGMSCGRIALERAGLSINQYYASEIDKHAIKVAHHKLKEDKSK